MWPWIEVVNKDYWVSFHPPTPYVIESQQAFVNTLLPFWTYTLRIASILLLLFHELAADSLYIIKWKIINEGSHETLYLQIKLSLVSHGKTPYIILIFRSQFMLFFFCSTPKQARWNLNPSVSHGVITAVITFLRWTILQIKQPWMLSSCTTIMITKSMAYFKLVKTHFECLKSCSRMGHEIWVLVFIPITLITTCIKLMDEVCIKADLR